ncbi:class F sortase [Rhodococcus sp. WS1]|uniref:class F sortase n=1 Tax=unclassified Rhodococcus (in: high G+C Gram-positive bacteria) TaxID=192944 RepID=UPI001144A9AB|nr:MULTISPECIES: class F sortase [unclassified Rhodococcus (in: high G+C Gram-positive bacteria)]ROZ52942.1 class F sortase [Rhodococcus sp. WS1]TQC36032.1 class F sortase [Rhodococcus sp. WS7]
MKDSNFVMAPRSRRAITAIALAVSALLTVVGCAGGQVDAGNSQPHPPSRQSAPSAPSAPDSVQLEKVPVTAAQRPVRLEIPSIGVDTIIIDLGLDTDGTLEVPPDGKAAGWYTGAPAPGEVGPAIIAGHVDWEGVDGVFFDLRNLEPGADIIVTRGDGSRAVFTATSIEHFPKENFPTNVVYGDLDHPGLRIITCGGSFDETARSYNDNNIAFADIA